MAVAQSMSAWEWVGTATVLTIFSSTGTACLFWPATVQKFLQRRYHDSILFRMTLFSKWVFRPWYPILLRLCGLILWSLVLLELVFSRAAGGH